MDVTGKRIAWIAIVLGIINFAIVTWIFLEQRRPTEPTPAQRIETTPIPAASPTSTSSADYTETFEQIEERLAALENRPTTTVTPKTSTGVKETFLYMGTGSTTSREWVTIDSASITFNPATYGKVKEIRFEAALSIISGEVSARLINTTTGAIYYDSSVTHNKSASEWKTSGAISLPPGNATYAVQLRSSNGERASLDGARLKIVVQ